ncbi:MAG: asparaginase [Rubellimicrobium sp.]|nr:asparaginase [Rubellimicrobium sp.]
MGEAVELVEVRRGGRVENRHRGHAVIMRDGETEAVWGDPDVVIYPRSSCKMIQALPLVESSAADAFGLGDEQLALACASHSGAAIHTARVTDWIAGLGLADDDFRCGAHEPADREARNALVRAGRAPCQVHNNCSGKHAGFLTLNRHIRGGREYVDPGHPVQQAVRAAFEEVTGERSPGFGIDGCSAPNFATTISGLARAMAGYAAAGTGGGVWAAAQARLVRAMIAHPALISGEGRACTELMRAARGRAAVKIGADGVYVAIIPDLATGVALKIEDGSARAAEAMIAALLVRLGVLDAADPVARRYANAQLLNWRGLRVGEVRVTAAV